MHHKKIIGNLYIHLSWACVRKQIEILSALEKSGFIVFFLDLRIS